MSDEDLPLEPREPLEREDTDQEAGSSPDASPVPRGAGRRIPPAIAAAASLALLLGAAGVWMVTRPGADGVRGGRGQFEVIAPVGEIGMADVGRMVWRPVENTVRYELLILSEAGKTVFFTITADTIAVLPISIPLSADANYRWWVTAVREDGAKVSSPAATFRLRTR